MAEAVLGWLTSLLLNNRELTCLIRGLAEAEELLNFAFVDLVNGSEVGEVTLLLLRLLGQDVTLEGVFALDLTRASERETLLSAGVCLQLRHFLSIYMSYYMTLLH